MERAARAAPSPTSPRSRPSTPDAVFAAGGCVARRSDDGGATFTRVAFTPVESSCKEQFAAGWFVNRLTGFLALDRRHRPAHRQQRRHLRPEEPAARHARAGRRGDARSTCASSPTRSASARPRTARSTAPPTARTRGRLVSDTTRAVRSFFFLDANNGFAVGDGSLFLVTKDGGATWTPKDIGIPPTNLRSISCATLTLCVMTTEPGTALVRTDDGGATARLVTPSQDPIFAAGFASPTRIAAGGATGATAVSDDAGLNFAPIGGRLSGTYTRVRAGGQAGHGVRAGRQRLAGQDDRRRQDVDARQRRDLGGRRRRRLPDGARRLRAGLVGRPVPHQRRRRHVEDPRHRHDGAPVPARRADDVDGHPRRPDRPAPLDRQRRHVLGRQGQGRRQGQARRDRPRRQRALRLGPPRPAALDRPRQDVDGAAQADRATASRPGSIQVDFLDAKNGYFLAQGGALWRTANAGQVVDRAAGRRHRQGATAWPSRRRPRATWSSTASATCRTASGFLLQARPTAARTWHPQFVVSTPDPGRRDRGHRGRHRLPARRAVELPVHHEQRRGRQGEHAERSRPSTRSSASRRASPSPGKLSPAAGNERVTRQLPAAGLEPLAAPDGQDRGQRLVHDELARARRAATASWPSGRATSAPRATARAC